MYIIKVCLNGKPYFHVLALEEPDEGNAPGLATALENAISKIEFTFSREDKEIGLCTDAALVNIRLWKLIRDELGGIIFCQNAYHTSLSYQLGMRKTVLLIKRKNRLILTFIIFLRNLLFGSDCSKDKQNF